MKTRKEIKIHIGSIFKYQNGLWKVTSRGIDGYYGCTSLHTNAFVPFETMEIENSLHQNLKYKENESRESY